MAAGGPTRALLQKIRVIDVPNENVPLYFLLLEMAFYTERRVAFVQQSLIDGSVRCMADHTTLTHRLVLIYKWAALLCVTLEAGFVSAQESKPAGFERLLNIRAATFDCDPFVRVVTIGTTHFSLENRMVVRQLKLCAHFEVTLETCFRRLPRIDDRTGAAAGFNVQTARPMARLAAHVLCVFPFRLQTRVSGRSEIAHDLFVAGRALF